jgi:hypothetical protein
MTSFFLDAAAPAAAAREEAMAETGLRGEWDGADDDRSLRGRDRGSGAGILYAGGYCGPFVSEGYFCSEMGFGA